MIDMRSRKTRVDGPAVTSALRIAGVAGGLWLAGFLAASGTHVPPWAVASPIIVAVLIAGWFRLLVRISHGGTRCPRGSRSWR